MLNGVSNSWLDTYNNQPPACIGDTINQTLNNSASSMITSGMAPLQTCWVWLVIGVAAGYLLSGKK